MSKIFKSQNGVTVKDGMIAEFNMFDSLEPLVNGFGGDMPMSGKITGAPFTNARKQNVVAIEESDEGEMYLLPVEKITIDIDMECEDCGEEFNKGELKSVMVPDAVGNGLTEMIGCPKCGSQNFILNDVEPKSVEPIINYYSIRVVKAKNVSDATDKVIDGEFDEEDDICDRILTAEQIKEVFSKL